MTPTDENINLSFQTVGLPRGASNNVSVTNPRLAFALLYLEACCSEPIKKIAQAFGGECVKKLDVSVWGLANIAPQQKKSFTLAKPIRATRSGVMEGSGIIATSSCSSRTLRH